jgi:cell division protein FtsB
MIEQILVRVLIFSAIAILGYCAYRHGKLVGRREILNEQWAATQKQWKDQANIPLNFMEEEERKLAEQQYIAERQSSIEETSDKPQSG